MHYMTSRSPEVDDLVQQMMAAYAQDAVDAARTGFGIDLDFSPPSVERVEQILVQIYPSIRRGWIRRLLHIGISDDQLDTLCKMFGGYVGEVVRRHQGGRWAIIENPAGQGNVIALVNGDDKIFPPAKVFKRLVEGESDNVWFYFQVVTEAEIFGAQSQHEPSADGTDSGEHA